MLDMKNPLIAERVKKLSEITAKGMDPYPYSFDKSHSSSAVAVEFQSLKNEEHSQKQVSVAGRIMTLRRMGKASFGHIQDESGKIQIYFRFDDIGESSYDLLKKCDIGDFIGVTGEPFRTKLGELSVYARSFSLLTKTLRPLPEKFHGLTDPELRYRKRYLDLIMNPEVREVFIKRSKIINAIRSTLTSKGFLEVETPILQPIYGGANARPFKSHLNSLDFDVYMRISNELYLKRLLVGGFEKVFEFAKDFRNEGIDKTHNPEFTQIELYQAWVDFNEIMKLVEELFQSSCLAVNDSLRVKWGQNVIDFTPPFERMTMCDAIKRYADIDVAALLDDELFELRITYNLEIEGEISRGLVIQKLFEDLVEAKLVQPVFITEHPTESTPLCKPSRASKGFVERFELFIAGMEFANAYSELNDPVLQRKLLEDQSAQLRGGVEEAHPMDEDFIQAIEFGMPPTGGVGIGIDRMVMALTNQESIRDVLLFPFMKPTDEE